MKTEQVIWLAACGGVLLLGACDAPQDSPRAAAADTQNELQEQTPTGVVISPIAGTRLTVPPTEAEHVAAITRLLAHPRPDAEYPEQVKLLTESYLKQYPDAAGNCRLAKQCFMNAILLQPDRFAGKDFDRAYTFCDYPTESELTGYLRLLKAELMLNDYRKSTQEKDAVLNTLYALFSQANSEVKTEPESYACYILAKYGPAERRREITELYFREMDSPHNPYRLRMLQLAELPAERLLPLVAETALHGGDAAVLLPFVRALCETPETAQRVQVTPELAYLYYAVNLEKLLDTPSVPREELEAAEKALRAALPATVSPEIYMVRARYYCAVAQWETAIAIYRALAATPGADTRQVQLALARALVHVPEGKAEAETVFSTLAQCESTELALSAMQGLYQLQLEGKRYNEVMETTAEMLRIDSDAMRRVGWMRYRAEAAKLTGNLTEAINLNSQMEAAYSGNPAVALPACKELIQLLVQRNFKQCADSKKGTYTPSDKWYAWVRGRDFVKGMRRSPELLQSLTPQQAADFDDICKLVDELGIDYDVIKEERDRAALPLR